MERVGIVDLGSGTARLVVYAYEPGRHYRLVDELREPVRLGQGLAASGRLAPEAVVRALAFLAAVQDYARATALERLDVFATSAVRSAANAQELLEPARRMGLAVRVLPGEEEARYGVLAVAAGFAFADAWVVDLGGGSAQLSRMRGRGFAAGRAYPLGAVRLSERFFSHDPPKAREVKALVAEVRAQLGEETRELRAAGGPLVAMGGTVRNLARAVQRARRYPLERLHGYFLRTDDLDELTERLLDMSVARRRRVAGLSPDRADVIAAGAVVFRTLLHEAKLPGLWISGFGVREGAFFRHFLPPPHRPACVRELHLASLEARFPQPRTHIQSVRELAARVFAALAPRFGLSSEDARLLDAAARLHDVGLAIDFYDHHKHGAYLVLQHTLAGWSHREQALLALLVRYHRKGRPRPGALAAVLDPGDDERLVRLAVLLRLAEHLERARSGRVRRLEVEVGAEAVTLRVGGPENPWVEVWEAQKDAALFERAFGLRLEVRSL